MNSTLKLFAVGVVSALMFGCGETGQEDSTTSTTGPGPVTATEGTPTGDAPTDGTEETGATGGTGDGPGDPALLQTCLDSFADGQKLVEAQCACLVDQGVFPDLAACLAGGETMVSHECICTVYSEFPAVKAGLDCARAAQTDALTCLNGVACTNGSDEFAACMEAYSGAVGSCAMPGPEVDAKVAIDCNMQAPFTCGTGEEIPDSWTCNFHADCGDESDEMACPDSFACVNGAGYIPLGYTCDGEPDCSDASDEVDCRLFVCTDGAMVPVKLTCNGKYDCEDRSDETSAASCDVFVCMGGPEIPAAYQCNGAEDCCPGQPQCMDSSDEMGCPTFVCGSGEEILLGHKCDGLMDCMDGSDEDGCPTFMCGSGEQVPLSYKCDDFADCIDSSDEADCP